MANYREYISALQQCAKEHENDKLFTGQINVSDLCSDTAKLLGNDVIERSKVDKAIEDINTEMSYGSARFMQETMYHKGLKRALEILKRNIGE